MDLKTNVVPHADIAVELRITSTMLTNNQVTTLRNSLVESLKLLTPTYLGQTVEYIRQQKLLESGLVLIVDKSLYEAFINGEAEKPLENAGE